MTQTPKPKPKDIYQQHLDAFSPYRRLLAKGCYTPAQADDIATRYVRRFGTPPACHCKTCLDYRARMVAALYGEGAAK